MNSYNTIVIKGVGMEDIENYEEGLAGGTILPGDIIKLHTDGTYIRNAEASVAVECLIATENLVLPKGSGLGGNVDTAYAATDPVSFVRVQTGMEVQVRAAASQVLTLGVYLTPNTGGKFVGVSSTEFRMFKSLEAGTTAADDLVLCRKV